MITLAPPSRHRLLLSILTLLPLSLSLPSCGNFTNIRGRDDNGVLYAGRARKLFKLRDGETTTLRLGPELGVLRADGNFSSSATTGGGTYDATFGYAAAALDVQIDKFHLTPKVGLSYGDVNIQNATAAFSEHDLGLLWGIEGRYEVLSTLEALARGTFLLDDEWNSSWLEVGLAWRPIDAVAIEVGYAYAETAAEPSPLLIPLSSAEVETQGLLIGARLEF